MTNGIKVQSLEFVTKIMLISESFFTKSYNCITFLIYCNFLIRFLQQNNFIKFYVYAICIITLMNKLFLCILTFC